MTWPHLDSRLDGWVHVLVHTSPVFLAPLVIYMSRSLLDFYYRRSIQYHEQELEAVKKQQKQKVEEMKQKMKYYVAKNLIERYESSSPRKPQTPTRKPSIRNTYGGRNVQSMDAGRSGAIDSMPALNSIPDDKSPLQQLQEPPMNSQMNPNIPIHNPQIPHDHSQLPQHPYQQQIAPPPPPMFQQTDFQPYQRTWIDRILDVIIGEESPSSKYALVCQQCFAHNGLASALEFEHVQYKCPKCGFFNTKRQLRNDNANDLQGQPRSDSQLSLRGAESDDGLSPAKSESALDDRSNRRVSDSFLPSNNQTTTNADDKNADEPQEQTIQHDDNGDDMETGATKRLVRKRSRTIATTRKSESNE